jgi:rubrerythrin
MHTSSRRGLLLPRTGNDADVVRALLRLERDAVQVYEAGASRLNGPAARLARQVLEQERAHVKGLENSLRRLGERPTSEPQPDVPGLQRAAAGGSVVFAGFAARHESEVIAAYLQALGRLRRPGLRSPVASILANEGQHLALFREALGRNPVPEAFETGGPLH